MPGIGCCDRPRIARPSHPRLKSCMYSRSSPRSNPGVEWQSLSGVLLAVGESLKDPIGYVEVPVNLLDVVEFIQRVDQA